MISWALMNCTCVGAIATTPAFDTLVEARLVLSQPGQTKLLDVQSVADGVAVGEAITEQDWIGIQAARNGFLAPEGLVETPTAAWTFSPQVRDGGNFDLLNAENGLLGVIPNGGKIGNIYLVDRTKATAALASFTAPAKKK